MIPKEIKLALVLAVGLMACEGGVFKKKNCKTCETITYGPQQTETNRITHKVCGEDQVSAHITANTVSTSSLTVVTTCQ
ncbi:MAG: hypothetical protein JWP57_641 [Spirosoma sp.]|nr:hypothetical protein [Spirosoma sp.]